MCVPGGLATLFIVKNVILIHSGQEALLHNVGLNLDIAVLIKISHLNFLFFLNFNQTGKKLQAAQGQLMEQSIFVDNLRHYKPLGPLGPTFVFL